MGIFIRRGISGQTVGNNFRRIFDGLRDADKLKKSQLAAKEFGLSLDFYGKDGKFAGIDNFVEQIGKLQGLSGTKVSAILKPFSGKQGLSTDFLEFLAKDGKTGMIEMKKQLEQQDSLDNRYARLMSSAKKRGEVSKTNWENAKVAIGTTLLPILKKAYDQFAKISTTIAEFSRVHPTLVKLIATGAAMISTIFLVAGAINMLKGTFIMMRVAAMANPVTAIIIGIALAAGFNLCQLGWHQSMVCKAVGLHNQNIFFSLEMD